MGGDVARSRQSLHRELPTLLHLFWSYRSFWNPIMMPLARLCFVYAQQGLSENERRQRFKARTKRPALANIGLLQNYVFNVHFLIGMKEVYNMYPMSLNTKWDKRGLCLALTEALTHWYKALRQCGLYLEKECIIYASTRAQTRIPSGPSSTSQPRNTETYTHTFVGRQSEENRLHFN